MRLTIRIALAAASLAPMPALAQAATDVIVHRGSDDLRARDAYGVEGAYSADAPGPGRLALRGGDVPFQDAEGLNAFFYPDGYDPQYGSEGRLADAEAFADSYGCAPIWNGKYGYYMPACN